MARASCRGFTLIELLAALALLGLMAAALFGALRVGVQSWERAEASSRRAAETRSAEDFLRRTLGAAFPLRAAPGAPVSFDGDGAALRFAAALPAHLGGGGFSTLTLRFAPRPPEGSAARAGRLVLEHAPLGGAARAAAEAQESVLLEGLDEARFDYFGRSNDAEKPAWRERWPGGPRVPSLVRLTLRYAGAPEAREMVLPVRLGEETGCVRAEFQRDCGQAR